MANRTSNWRPSPRQLVEDARRGDLASVERHLEKGVDVNATGKEGGPTALLMACNAGHEDVALRLLQHPCINLNARSGIFWGNFTALWAAAKLNLIRVVRGLLQLEHRVDVNATDEVNGWHWTPLQRATVNGHLEVVQLLLQRPDVRVGVRDHQGRTALELAEQYRRGDVAQVLANYMRQHRVVLDPLQAVSSSDSEDDGDKLRLEEEGGESSEDEEYVDDEVENADEEESSDDDYEQEDSGDHEESDEESSVGKSNNHVGKPQSPSKRKSPVKAPAKSKTTSKVTKPAAAASKSPLAEKHPLKSVAKNTSPKRTVKTKPTMSAISRSSAVCSKSVSKTAGAKRKLQSTEDEDERDNATTARKSGSPKNNNSSKDAVQLPPKKKTKGTVAPTAKSADTNDTTTTAKKKRKPKKVPPASTTAATVSSLSSSASVSSLSPDAPLPAAEAVDWQEACRELQERNAAQREEIRELQLSAQALQQQVDSLQQQAQGFNQSYHHQMQTMTQNWNAQWKAVTSRLQRLEARLSSMSSRQPQE